MASHGETLHLESGKRGNLIILGKRESRSQDRRRWRRKTQAPLD
jgi:hypothetical protein